MRERGEGKEEGREGGNNKEREEGKREEEMEGGEGRCEGRLALTIS